MNLKVLLVDDEALARARLRTLLGGCTDPGAHMVQEAANAAQAMTALQRGTFDVVLLDVHMPGMDGVTFAKTMARL